MKVAVQTTGASEFWAAIKATPEVVMDPNAGSISTGPNVVSVLSFVASVGTSTQPF